MWDQCPNMNGDSPKRFLELSKDVALLSFASLLLKISLLYSVPVHSLFCYFYCLLYLKDIATIKSQWWWGWWCASQSSLHLSELPQDFIFALKPDSAAGKQDFTHHIKVDKENFYTDKDVDGVSI